jgi:hypothetical protein
MSNWHHIVEAARRHHQVALLLSALAFPTA